MGNRSLCSSTTLQCTHHCARISGGISGDSAFLGNNCDPAGAVFEETLDSLNDLDKQLLLFSSSSNVLAVRWLLALGADPRACDSNGTTCLHATCRSGSVAIAKTLLDDTGIRDDDKGKEVEKLVVVAGRVAGPAAAVDVAGWTPLHIAAFMGRRDITALLLRFKASLEQANHAGQTAADLCSDHRTRAVMNTHVLSQSVAKPNGATIPPETASERLSDRESCENRTETVPLGSPSIRGSDASMRYEPFFVPRTAAIRGLDRDPSVLREAAQIGQAIFNRQPGCGLAFLVASGCTRDYPIDLTAFLRRSRVDLGQIGNFLGEGFSLAQILRLEFLNSLTFQGTGVVACVSKAFLNLGVPPNLQKLDRILHSLAEVWWRQHEALFRDEDNIEPSLSGFAVASGREGLANGSARVAGDENGELAGVELRRVLPNLETLRQLMFSSVMLHWNLHAPSPDGNRLSLNSWMELNRGLLSGGLDLPLEIQVPIYRALYECEIKQLHFGAHDGAQVPKSGAPTPLGKQSAISEFATMEGWVRINGGDLQLPSCISGGTPADGVAVGGAFSPAARMSTMLSEATPSSRKRSPDETSTGLPEMLLSVSKAVGSPREGIDSSKTQQQDVAWLSLSRSLLFFSSEHRSEVGSPFAFVYLPAVRLSSIEPSKGLFALDGGIVETTTPNGVVPMCAPVQIVFLLQDARWQTCDIPRLELEVCDRTQLENWVLKMSDQCSMEDLAGSGGLV